MNNNFYQHILVFDSGFGGLSVAREIHQLYPSCRISYLADNAFFPYGLKSDAALTARILCVLRQAIDLIKPDIVVVACNTASTIVLAELRQAFILPFVGVVPAIKPAAALTQTRTLGILATPATINRAYTDQLIADFAQDIRVIRHGSRQLVLMAEAQLLGQPAEPAALLQELNGLLLQPGGAAIDTIVLACTHFPLLKQELMAVCPRPMVWVDSGLAVAKRVGGWLQQLAVNPKPLQPYATIQFYHTGEFSEYRHLPQAIALQLDSSQAVELCYFGVE